MHDTDLVLWGLIVVPIGVVVCFGPALLVWIREEIAAGSEEKNQQNRKP